MTVPANHLTTRIGTPEDVLRVTDRTLGQTIEQLTGVAPELRVARQWHVEPPLAPGISPPLDGSSRVLGRCTAYRVSGIDVSRNVAYVDLGRVSRESADALEDGRLNLGQLFLDPSIAKHDFVFGSDEDADEFELVLRAGFPELVGESEAFVWRRYLASNDAGVAFIVVESLPVSTWEVFLPQRAEITRRSSRIRTVDGRSAPERYNATSGLLEGNVRDGRGADPYLRVDDRTWSYDEVVSAADGAGAGFFDLGLHPGDRVVLALADSPEMVAAFWGAMKAGLVPVPIASGLAPADVRFILGDSEARLVVCDDTTASSVLPAVEDADVRCLTVGSPRGANAHTWSEVCERDARLSPAATTDDDIALWLYTSGTTGQPKAVMHRHRSLRAAGERGLAAQVARLGTDDVVLSASKSFFAYGLGNSIYQPAAAGASVVLNRGPSVPQRIESLAERNRPTVLFAVPSFLSAYVRVPDASLSSSVRLVFSAGESLSPDLHEAFRARFGRAPLDGLGSTEALHHVTSARPDDVVVGSAGRPLDGYRIEVRTRDGDVVREGEQGELWVTGPTLFAGYWRRPDVTRDVRRDGWIRTGDAVRVREGHLFHEGRLDDLFKLGGMWVSPRGIEDVLREHPLVTDAAVVMVEDSIGVPVLKAFVVPSQGNEAALRTELARHCRDRLAMFKRPRYVEVVGELPRTPTGKLRRFVLREGVAREGRLEYTA
jgi:benzoate-CoA ligase family protein